MLLLTNLYFFSCVYSLIEMNKEAHELKFTFCELLNENRTFAMKVHLIKEKTIRDYVPANAGSSIPFIEWLSKAKKADWEKPADIKKTFPSADLLGKGSSRVVFDIGGNNYRMICKYAFGEISVRLYVCWIGTHGEYDKVCNGNKQYTVSGY